MIKNLIVLITISISNAFTPKIYLNSTIELSRGSIKKGQTIFSRHIQFECNISYTKFAILHTQQEWEEIAQAGKFKEEIFKICPKVKKKYQNGWTPHLYQFAYEYAIDSGNIPYY